MVDFYYIYLDSAKIREQQRFEFQYEVWPSEFYLVSSFTPCIYTDAKLGFHWLLNIGYESIFANK
jgi:hypothetical protein